MIEKLMMKKLFASLPMIWLILGAIAIATEIKADYAFRQTPTVTIQTAVLTAAIAHHNGYLATFIVDTSK